MHYGEEASPDVLNDDDHELFEDYIEMDDTQRETTRTRGGRVIKRPTHLDDYGVYPANTIVFLTLAQGCGFVIFVFTFLERSYMILIWLVY